MICENTASYGEDTQATDGGTVKAVEKENTDKKKQSVRTLKEIRFDRVYHR